MEVEPLWSSQISGRISCRTGAFNWPCLWLKLGAFPPLQQAASLCLNSVFCSSAGIQKLRCKKASGGFCVSVKMEDVENTAGPQCCCLPVFIGSEVNSEFVWQTLNTHGRQHMEPIVAYLNQWTDESIIQTCGYSLLNCLSCDFHLVSLDTSECSSIYCLLLKYLSLSFCTQKEKSGEH